MVTSNSKKKKKTYLKWYELSTSSMWCMACCKWLAASWTCWSFQGESWLIDVRWTVFCARCTLKLMSYTTQSCKKIRKRNQLTMEHSAKIHISIKIRDTIILTACDILSPVSVATHFKWSCGTVNMNLSCLRPSLPYNGTGKRCAHSCIDT